ncbi:MAG: hypothetical protein ACJARG_001188, partial [Arcticibacterium sp.]
MAIRPKVNPNLLILESFSLKNEMPTSAETIMTPILNI